MICYFRPSKMIHFTRAEMVPVVGTILQIFCSIFPGFSAFTVRWYRRFHLGRRWTSWTGRGTAPPLSSTLSTPPLRTAFSSLPASSRYHFFYCALQRKSDFCTPSKETVRPQSEFPHSRFCKRFIYFHDRSTYLFCSRLRRPIMGII